jgi:hypothetical protein
MAFRPPPDLLYERMFPLAHNAVKGDGGDAAARMAAERVRPSHTRAPRAAGFLRLVRDFLLLEDDYEVGWEAEYVKEDQAPDLRPRKPEGAAAAAAVRCPGARLRGRLPRVRRRGQPEARLQVCVSAPAQSRPSVSAPSQECACDRRFTGSRG